MNEKANSREMNRLLKHAFGNFVVALVIVILAVVLAAIGEWCVKLQLPAYISFGVQTIVIVLLIADGIVVCGTAVIMTVRMLKMFWKSSEHED